MKRKQKRQVPVIESLEPRILLSADLPGLDIPDFDPDDSLNVDVDQVLARAYQAFQDAEPNVSGTSGEPVQDTQSLAPETVDEPDTALPSNAVSEDVRRELIIVDPSVPDYELLLAGVNAVNGEGTRVDVVMIDPERNGVDQITQLLLKHEDLDAIHLISHGSEGAIHLGSETIDLASLKQNEDLVRSWGDALGKQGDILIYGCDLAASEAGELFVDTLAQLTGADVAASEDLTGHESLGGDWELEYQTGKVEAAVAFTGEGSQAWEATLAAGIALNDDGGNDDYLISDTGLPQSLAATTVEIRFAASTTYTPFEMVFMSFNNAIDDEFTLQIDSPTGNLELDFGNGIVQYSSAIHYESLLDGNIHTLSVTWDNTNGDWAVYVDGGFIDSGTGLNAGNALDTMNGQFVFGQEQDLPDGGYDPLQYFSGTLYDVRIWNEVRSAGDIALNYQDPFDVGSLPSGLVANWQMDGFNGANEVVDVVGGNNLTVGHVSGAGYSNDAPTLAGANDLASIVEDSVSNTGTLVSDLISGQVGDPDAGAVAGIAVTAVDDTNGTWQYTVDNGSNWYAFGVVDDSSARLLAADVNSSVRFVPDADWYGTVNNGITFHAWDQSSGTAGATADLTSLTSSQTVLDQFDAVFYGGNDGSVNWLGDWQEIGESDGASLGNVTIPTVGEVVAGPYLSIDLSALGTGISRAVNLSNTVSATLSFTYEQLTTSSGGEIVLEVFDGSSWNVVQTYNVDSDFYVGAVGVYQSFDISAYADANTEIRFRTTQAASGDGIYIDDVQIAYTSNAPNVGGATAFSSATASSSITINPVNDAATIGGVDAANLIEDTGAIDGHLSATGTLIASDVDNPDDTFTAASHRGSLGDLTIDGSGNWTYSVANSLPGIQTLAAGSSVNDVITVSSIDGTTHDITITITGNPAPTAVGDAYTVDENGTLAIDWWDADWSRRSVITFDNSGQAETLADVPVLVVLNGGNIDYALTQNDGSDLRFFDGAGNTLAYDIEEWNESGDSYVWVKVPQITGGSNTDTITMYWGNASAASAENASAVWTNGYAAVNHLHDDFNDATVLRNAGTNSGSVDTDGQVGDGQLFDGVDDFVSLADDASIQNIFDGGGTVSAWIYATGWGEGDYGRIFDKSGNTLPSNTGWALELFGGGQNALLFQVGFSGNMGQWYTGSNSISLNTWNHVSLTYDASDPSNVPEIYINGQLQTLNSTQPTGTVGSDVGYDLTVGNHAAATSRTFEGTIDNVQVSSTTRSADWIKAQYLATSGLFASVGAGEAFGSTAGVLDNDTVPDPHPPQAMNLDATGTIGLVTLNNDGTFTYDTNGQFDYLAAGVDATDTFSYTLDDGVNPSTVATVTVTVTGSNDAPVASTIEGAALAYTENAGVVSITSTLSITDVDDTNIESAVVQISGNYANGEDLLAFTDQLGISGSWNGVTGELTLTGTATLADYETALRSISYSNGSENPSTATRTVSFTVNDGDIDSNTLTRDITVASINDDPINAGSLPSDITVTEDVSSDVDLSAIDLSDVDQAGGNLILTLSTSTGGNLTAVSGGGVTVGGSGSGILTLTGSQADLNTYLDTASNVQYLHGTANLAGNDVDTLSVLVNDSANSGSGGGTDQALGTVNVDISAVNDVGVFGGDLGGSGAEDGGAISGTLSFTDAIDGASAPNFTVTGAAGNGSASIDAVTGAWSYTPGADFNGTDSFTVTVTDDDGHSETQVINLTVTPMNDAPVVGGVSAGVVSEDADPDLDTLLEAAGTLTIADPDAGESNFVAGTVAGSHGNLIIDAFGNWDYEADNTQSSIQQLDAGESVNDVLTVTTADGTSHNVTVTINGSEDAAVIGGVMAGAVVEDGTLVANGALSITDVDASDNPVSFPDQASTPGDNGYGDFQLTAGSWSYMLNNGHAAVQALAAGGSLTDTHTFIASDGSTEVVSITIAGASEAVPPPAGEPPPSPETTPESPPIEPPPAPEDLIDPPVEQESDPEEPPFRGRTDPSMGEPETVDPSGIGLNPTLPEPLEPGEIFLSVINDARPNDASGVQKSATAAAKPDVEAAQTFLQELKSFWQYESTTASVEMSEVRFSQEFWDGLDKMASDLDQSVEEQDRQMQLSAEAAAGVGISLTAGFVSWALRAGSMAASFLAAMPAWRHFDPMPVLVEDKGRTDKAVSDAEEEELPDGHDQDTSLDDLFER